MLRVSEEYYVYQLTIPTVPAGGVIGVPRSIQNDAAFVVRSVKTRNLGAMGFRFKTALGTYVSSPGYMTDKIWPTGPGELPYPNRDGVKMNGELVYPPGGTILVDIENTTGVAINNVEVIFTGVKMREGKSMLPAYPSRMATQSFQQQEVLRALPLVQATPLQMRITVKQETDFIFRGGLCDPFVLGVEGGPAWGVQPANGDPISGAFGNFTNVYCMLLDNEQTPYSNEPIHVNEIFGQNNPFPSIANGGQDAPAMFRAGLYCPQIYVERLKSLYVNFFRNDTTPGMGPVDLWVRWSGQKVYPK